MLSAGRVVTDSPLGLGTGRCESEGQVDWLTLSSVFIRYSDEYKVRGVEDSSGGGKTGQGEGLQVRGGKTGQGEGRQVREREDRSGGGKTG